MTHSSSSRRWYGAAPREVGIWAGDLGESMRWLYLPVWIPGAMEGRDRPTLPASLECLRGLLEMCLGDFGAWAEMHVYVTARRGWARPGHPLNRPGWHSDGFGTSDINYTWYRGCGPTRFAIQEFRDISTCHLRSLEQFEEQVDRERVVEGEEGMVYRLDSGVIHATPEIREGGMRSFVKISISSQRYNLEGNSHNYDLTYRWRMWARGSVRNDPARAGRDYV